MADIVFKNELGKEMKIMISNKKLNGLKGAKNTPVTYKGCNLILRSVEHSTDINMTKKELFTLKKIITQYLKDAGKKSEIED